MYDATSRTFTIGELLDATFTLYRENFILFFGIALLAQLPLIAFWLFLPLFGGGASTQIVDLGTVLTLPYALFATFLMFGALTHAAARAYAGEPVTIGESFAWGLRRWFTLAFAWLVASVLMFLGLMLLVIPGVILFAMYFAVTPAAVVERRGAIAALGRSRQLSKGARLRILAVLIIAWLIAILPTLAFSMLAGVGAVALSGPVGVADPGAGAAVWLAGPLNAGSNLMSALTLPFMIIASLLLFHDRRARTEAPDLEVAAETLVAETL